MTDSQEKGRQFEKEAAKELGLDLVPGSGNQWHSKLDLKGRATRWSLKFTDTKSYRLDQSDIDEAYVATQGLTGDGRVPLWLVRLQTSDYDLVIMKKEDFLALQSGEVEFYEEKIRKSDIRRARAKVPFILREE